MENYKEHIIGILNKASYNIFHLDDEMVDREELLNIILCYEECKRSLENVENGNARILKIFSKSIEMWKSFINDNCSHISVGLKTANDGIVLIKDIFENGSKNNNYNSKIDDVLNRLDTLLEN